MTEQQMQTAAWLERYQQSLADEKRLLEEMQMVRSRAERITKALNLAAVQGGSGGPDKVQRGAEQLWWLAKRLEQRAAESVECRLQIQRALDEVEDAKLRTLLELRYLLGLHWEEVSDRMHIDSRWLRRLHPRALDAVQAAAVRVQCRP